MRPRNHEPLFRPELCPHRPEAPLSPRGPSLAQYQGRVVQKRTWHERLRRGRSLGQSREAQPMLGVDAVKNLILGRCHMKVNDSRENGAGPRAGRALGAATQARRGRATRPAGSSVLGNRRGHFPSQNGLAARTPGVAQKRTICKNKGKESSHSLCLAALGDIPVLVGL